MEIEEKYDLMKRDLDKAVNEVDKLDEICYRLERENSEYYSENEKLKELLKRCKRHINASFPEIYRELLQEINQALGEE